MRTTEQPLLLTLTHCPNPDIGGYYRRPVSPRTTVRELSSLADAPRVASQWIKANGLGSGNIAEIRVDGPAYTFWVSFNGRVWDAPYWLDNAHREVLIHSDGTYGIASA